MEQDTGWIEAYRGLTADEAVARAEGEGRRVRVLRPGSIVTMDYSPARLNVHVDDDGQLVDVRAG